MQTKRKIRTTAWLKRHGRIANRKGAPTGLHPRHLARSIAKAVYAGNWPGERWPEVVRRRVAAMEEATE